MTESIKDLPALPPSERAAVVLQSSKAAADLTALVASSQSITAITSADGRTECHAAAMKARAARVNVEKIGKDARDDATAFSKAVISEVARLTAIIEPEQNRLLILRDEWDAKIEAEKAAKAEAERLRVAEIRRCIDELRDMPLQAVGKTAATIATMTNALADRPVGESFAEFATEAAAIKVSSLSRLSDMHATALAQEAETARLAEEKRIADAKAEQERIEREAEAKRQREENERIRRENEAEAARLKVETDRLRAENEAAAATMRADREAFEKMQREVAEQQRQNDAAEAKAKADAEAAKMKADDDAIALIASLGSEQQPDPVQPAPLPESPIITDNDESIALRAAIVQGLFDLSLSELKDVAQLIADLQSQRGPF